MILCCLSLFVNKMRAISFFYYIFLQVFLSFPIDSRLGMLFAGKVTKGLGQSRINGVNSLLCYDNCRY